VRLSSYESGDGIRLGVLVDGGVVDVQRAGRDNGADLPSTMRDLIALGQAGVGLVEQAVAGATPTPLLPGQIVAPIPDLHKNVFAVGQNYRAHLEEAARARGVEPVMPPRVVLFSKPPTAVIGHEASIEFDEMATEQLDYEAELVVVIGRRGRDIPIERANDYIFGYTIGNDISARDVQRAHGQFFKGKAMDTFCPLGPCVVPSAYIPNPQDLRIALRVNGEPRQEARTSDMIFSLPEIIHQLSIGLTLEPGDLIMTGTPSGVALGMTPQRWLQPGDVIEVEIEGIGVLRNTVVRAGGAAKEPAVSAQAGPIGVAATT
jgi:2-keto-4-pentenoate hydratase/2-oxohepta-3-ene-1,7-dioic acid hydratase in catechol pathway